MEQFFSFSLNFEELNRNRDKVIQKQQQLKKFVAEQPSNYLAAHLGCGDDIIDGFINVDKYNPKCEVQEDIRELSFSKNSLDLIYSQHALEHIPQRHIYATLQHWTQLLKPSGKLILGLPDVELCMKYFIVHPDHNKWNWFIYTVYGWQTDPKNRDPEKWDYALDYGQFHQGGINKSKLEELCQKNNLKIQECFNYNGYGTPSVWIECVK